MIPICITFTLFYSAIVFPDSGKCYQTVNKGEEAKGVQASVVYAAVEDGCRLTGQWVLRGSAFTLASRNEDAVRRA